MGAGEVGGVVIVGGLRAVCRCRRLHWGAWGEVVEVDASLPGLREDADWRWGLADLRSASARGGWRIGGAIW